VKSRGKIYEERKDSEAGYLHLEDLFMGVLINGSLGILLIHNLTSDCIFTTGVGTVRDS